jgi:hypothetical protein
MSSATASGATTGEGQGSGETRKERIDRELMELLTELRVALPGVQFLFAFLLIVPFQETFQDATSFQRGAYFVALVAAAFTTGMLIGPAAQHRVLFRQRDKEALLRRSNRAAMAGLTALILAIASVVLLVIDFLFGRTLGWVTAVGVAALLTWWWVVVPFWKRSRNKQDDLPA